MCDFLRYFGCTCVCEYELIIVCDTWSIGLHIMLDENINSPRIKFLNVAEWSPLQAHVLAGDTLEAIDRVPCNTITFEQVLSLILCVCSRPRRRALEPKSDVRPLTAIGCGGSRRRQW